MKLKNCSKYIFIFWGVTMPWIIQFKESSFKTFLTIIYSFLILIAWYLYFNEKEKYQ